MDARPEDGDIVIRRELRNPRSVFVLRTVPGPDQLVYPDGDAALAIAQRAARHLRTRVWSTHDNQAFTLVDNFRTR